jgi:FAD/FMN-containing dehydrogenase
MIRDGRIDLRDDLLTRTVYGTDNSIYQRAPRAVLQPESVSEIVDFLRANYHAHERSSIVGRGGGTGTNGQSLTDGVVIDVKKHLCRLTD